MWAPALAELDGNECEGLTPPRAMDRLELCTRTCRCHHRYCADNECVSTEMESGSDVHQADN